MYHLSSQLISAFRSLFGLSEDSPGEDVKVPRDLTFLTGLPNLFVLNRLRKWVGLRCEAKGWDRCSWYEKKEDYVMVIMMLCLYILL